jgi:hypothetical protein
LGLENQIRLRWPQSGARVCFSPEADFTSAVVVGAVGVATLTKVRHQRELLLAALPVAFACHELAEGFVWLRLRGTIPRSDTKFALYAYLSYAWRCCPRSSRSRSCSSSRADGDGT